MILLGFVFVALAAGTAVGIIADNANHTTSLTLSTMGKSIHGMNVADIFLLGAAVAAVFLLGCALVTSGVRRSTRARRELRDLRYQQEENVQTLLAEKAQLERELARERRHSADPVASRPAPSVRLTPGDLGAG